MSTIAKEAVRSLIADLTGLQTVWDNDPHPFVSDTNKAVVYVKWKSLTQLGDREVRRPYNSGDDEIALQYMITRPAVVSIRCESYSASSEAYEFLDDLLIKLNRISSQERLNVYNVAIYDMQDIVDVSGFQDNRAVSIAVLDINLMLANTDEPPPAENPSFIETVNTDDTVGFGP